MIATVFVDTNVFVCARDAAAGPKQAMAAAWLEHLWRAEAGRTSAQVLSEYFITVTRKLSPGMSADQAWEDVVSLLTWNPQAMDAALLQRGREIGKSHRLSWWDSLVVAAAQLQDCALLLSEDLPEGQYGGVTVHSPFTLGVNESAALYASQPTVASRHPPRGRPRRA
jgi:predicted nucleic acid-binding protein